YADVFNWIGYINFPYTILAEIIYPQNRVVVDYKGLEDLVALGVINLTTMHDEPMFRVRAIADSLGMPTAKEYKYELHKLLEMKKTISANEEGWIVKFKNGKRLKIKGDEDLKVHRAVYGLSDKAKVKAWADDKIEELIMLIPEEFREEIENMQDGLDKQAKMIHTILTLLFQSAVEMYSERKEFAIFVNKAISKEYRRFM